MLTKAEPTSKILPATLRKEKNKQLISLEHNVTIGNTIGKTLQKEEMVAKMSFLCRVVRLLLRDSGRHLFIHEDL